MQKRIRRSAIFTTLICLLFFMGVCLFWVNESFTNTVRGNMDSYLKSAVILTGEPSDYDTYARNLSGAFDFNVRVTVIGKNGDVLGDSHSNAAAMGNHGGRPEVRAAFADGYGEDIRKSETRGTNTMYMARALADGAVLRLAIPFTPVPDFLLNVLPAFIISFFIAVLFMVFVSKKAAERVLAGFRQFSDMLSQAVEAAVSGSHEKLPAMDLDEEFGPIVFNYENLVESLQSYIIKINEKQSEIEKIIHSMAEGLLLLDLDFNILIANPQGLETFGITPLGEEKNMIHLYRDETFTSALKEVKESGTRIIYNLEKKDGRIYNIIISTAAEDGFVILSTDITHVKRLEKVRSEFSANVSHELKTPITSISGFAELINKGMVTDPGKIREYCYKIYSESQRLIELIDDMLKLSEIEGAAEGNEETIDMKRVFNSVADILGEKAAGKNIAVTIEGEGQLKMKYSHFVELATNLMDNAIKYNQEGGKIHVQIFASKENAGFWIEDTGGGIPPEEQERIFERFYRVDKGRDKKIEGTGLGLSIVKHIVLLYDGTIGIDSTEKGARFTVCFQSN